MKVSPFQSKLLSLLLILLLATPTAYAIDAVASLGKLSGEIEVLRKIGVRQESRKIPGRTGLILNDRDIVTTGRRAKATIIFRDGSEIRLFQKTRFVIEKSEESKTGTRRFFHHFKLTLGSFWGKFTKGRQRTMIKTPTATIGIKGTNVAFVERNGKLDISLSAGLISIENEDEKILLQPGQRVQGMTREGNIQEKVGNLPYRVLIKPDNTHIQLPKAGQEKEMFFTLQIIENKTQKNIYRSGAVYLSLELDKIVFDEYVSLNQRGYARIRAKIKPFQKADYKNGQVQIFAVMDGEEFMDVGAGQTVLTYDIPKTMSRTIRINVDSGEVTQ
ncbi:MAG: hypothetical protein COB67_02135 [SAR324 cluster bacterium]|uniref:FecR protein domain-containing protein n=1 Tax=SAR324 cluster bacterium TaxID=2024889 RepID=A0A2A4T9I9_9DELT|nr:MAG: hypothetical protein COB67_02135 [SAR324 cluster bacterium]